MAVSTASGRSLRQSFLPVAASRHHTAPFGFGALFTLTVILAWIGIPFVVFGWWLRRFGRRNIETVEAAYADFVAAGAATTA